MHKIQQLIKQINKTHKHLGELIAMNIIAAKAKKTILNVAPAGCGKSTATDTTYFLMKDRLRQGETLFADGKIEKAEKCFLKILEHDPQNKEVLNNLGVIAFQSQQIENAIDYFDKSLKLDPFYKDAVLNYTHLLKELKLLNEASPFLYKIMEKYPNDKELNQPSCSPQYLLS